MDGATIGTTEPIVKCFRESSVLSLVTHNSFHTSCTSFRMQNPRASLGCKCRWHVSWGSGKSEERGLGREINGLFSTKNGETGRMKEGSGQFEENVDIGRGQELGS